MMKSELPIETLYEAATILVENVPDGAHESVHATLTYLHHSDELVSPETLKKYAPCGLSNVEARNIVFELRTSGILTDDGLDANAMQEAFTGAKLLATEPEIPANTFVATLPELDDALEGVRFYPLLSGTIELIQTAEEEVVLMSPFLSEEAFDQLRGALRTATGNGASITLITNSLTYGKEDYNRTFTRCLLNDEKLGPVTTCFEYIDRDSWTTFHAKIITVDGQSAYLGTANLTHKGLTENLELGVIFRDDTAKRLSELVNTLRGSRFTHEVMPDASGETFTRR
jgi:phosphatidylserine/phosphatidylglycerophosphate/cardiolipin synthase-like enzyme